MHVLRAAEHRSMPWKNGGGSTVEIAISPKDATLDAFDWRMSMAHVEADGPFSAFAGINRTLCVLEGEGLRLEVEGQAPISLTPASEPYAFAADAPTAASLLGGPVLDLNIMTRRGRFGHSVQRLASAGSLTLQLQPGISLLLVHGGDAVVATAGDQATLGSGDAVLAETTPGESWTVELAEGASLYQVSIMQTIG